MKIKTLLITVVFAAIAGQIYCRSTFPVLKESDIPGAKITETRHFSETSLYGYIDGGAELYIEYGFDSLEVSQLVVNKEDIKVEIYRMNDADAAFGIFSVSRYRCNEGPKLTEYFCRTAYQLQFCKGTYYVSIINETGEAQEQAVSEKIAQKLLSQIDESSFNPDLFFPSGVTDEDMKSAVLVRGKLGIFNGAPSLSEILEPAAGYTALIIRKDNNTLTSVKFDSEMGAREYMKSQDIDRDILMKGESVPTASGAKVSMICLQHLLIESE